MHEGGDTRVRAAEVLDLSDRREEASELLRALQQEGPDDPEIEVWLDRSMRPPPAPPSVPDEQAEAWTPVEVAADLPPRPPLR